MTSSLETYDLDAGEERRLTDATGDAEGPDYGPDGRWIWFNSSRASTMQQVPTDDLLGQGDQAIGRRVLGRAS